MKGNLRLSSEGACSLLNADRSNYDSNETKSKTLATNNKRYLIRNFTQQYRISNENGKYRKIFRANAMRNFARLHHISYY